MQQFASHAARLNHVDEPRYSICTMFNDRPMYERCRASFLARGFGEDDCEYLVVDNSAGNVADAYVALNAFFSEARGNVLVIAHQDIILLDDDRAALDARLAELADLDPTWAVAGNAGFTAEGFPAFCVSDQYNPTSVCGAPFPVRVQTLDENLLIVRRRANLAVSRDLGGYHHYGPDLCLHAESLGWTSYVIDFFVRHESNTGPIDAGYRASARAFQTKYAKAFRSRELYLATGQHMLLSSAKLRRWAARPARLAAKLLGRTPRNRDIWAAAALPKDSKYAAAYDRLAESAKP